MDSKTIRRISIWLVNTLLLLACVLPFSVTPTPVQAPAIQEPELLENIIAQTVAAAQTQTTTALPSPTLTPTITFTPTATFTSTPTFIFSLSTATLVPTETVVPVFSVGGTVVPGSGDSVFTGKEWTCLVTGISPPYGAKIKAGTSFYAIWTLLNTGTKTWTNNGVDLVYTGGFGQDGKPIQDLSLTTAPGGKLSVKVLFTTSKKKLDTFNAYWSLKVGKRQFCGMSISFEVVN